MVIGGIPDRAGGKRARRKGGRPSVSSVRFMGPLVMKKGPLAARLTFCKNPGRQDEPGKSSKREKNPAELIE